MQTLEDLLRINNNDLVAAYRANVNPNLLPEIRRRLIHLALNYNYALPYNLQGCERNDNHRSTENDTTSSDVPNNQSPD